MGFESKVKTKIGPLEVDEAGNLTNDSTRMAELLVAQYNKMFSKPRNRVEPIPQKTTKTFDNIQFTEEEVVAAIDGFPAIMLKECKHQLACGDHFAEQTRFPLC